MNTMSSSTSLKNIINNNSRTVVNSGNYSYIFITTNDVLTYSKNKQQCKGCKNQKAFYKTLYKETLCRKCFVLECCIYCKRWNGTTLCEGCED